MDARRSFCFCHRKQGNACGEPEIPAAMRFSHDGHYFTSAWGGAKSRLMSSF
jgi:hypothetical protein